jgi:hypothetical protein
LVAVQFSRCRTVFSAVIAFSGANVTLLKAYLLAFRRFCTDPFARPLFADSFNILSHSFPFVNTFFHFSEIFLDKLRQGFFTLF